MKLLLLVTLFWGLTVLGEEDFEIELAENNELDIPETEFEVEGQLGNLFDEDDEDEDEDDVAEFDDETEEEDEEDEEEDSLAYYYGGRRRSGRRGRSIRVGRRRWRRRRSR